MNGIEEQMWAQAEIFKCTIWNAEHHPKQLRLKQFLTNSFVLIFVRKQL